MIIKESELRETIRVVITEAAMLDKVLDSIQSVLDDVVAKLSDHVDKETSILGISQEDIVSAAPEIAKAGNELKQAAEDLKSIPTAQTEALFKAYSLMLHETGQFKRTKRLNEISGFELIGIGLATPAVLAKIFKGLAWVAKKLKMPKASTALQKLYETIHHFEESMLDKIPDKLAYKAYTAGKKIESSVTSKNKKTTSAKSVMTEEQFVADKEERMKAKKRLFAIAILPWLINGISSIDHIISNMHTTSGAVTGAAETAATITKAGEHAAAFGGAARTLAAELAALTGVSASTT